MEELLLTLVEEEELLLTLVDPEAIGDVEAKGEDREDRWSEARGEPSYS